MTKLQTIFSALLLCFAAATSAEISTGSGTSQNSVGRPGAPNWSGVLEKTDVGGPDIAKDLPSESRMLSDHLVGEDAAAQGVGVRKLPARTGLASPTTATATGNAPSSANGASGNANAADFGPNVFDAVKGDIKPIKEQIDTSEVMQSVREFDASVSGTLGANVGAAPNGQPAQAVRPLTAVDQSQRDKIAFDQAFQNLIDEIKPWAFGLLGLAVVGYLASLVWNFLHWKSKGDGKRRTSSKSGYVPIQSESANESKGSRERRKHRTRKTQSTRNAI